MGVPAIWEFLKPYIKDRRKTLKGFVCQFRKENGRSPRIAIDGHNWLFECGFYHNDARAEPFSFTKDSHDDDTLYAKPYMNMIHKLKELSLLDVSFVIVFDGPLKPKFKRQKETLRSITGTADVDTYLTSYVDSYRSFQTERPEGMMKKYMSQYTLKKVQELLNLLKVNYTFAYGEGESHCAWLQISDHVDYVMSNDSDTLMFGATRVLRNLSKNLEDKSPSSRQGNNSTSSEAEYYITEVNLQEINQKYGLQLSSASLLFFSLIIGGDYNSGLSGLGKTKALTLMNLQSPNFVKRLMEIFHDIELDVALINSEYEKFQKEVYEYCQDNGRELFGRNYRILLSKENFRGWPEPYIVFHYIYPIIDKNVPSNFLTPDFFTSVEGSSLFRSLDFVELMSYLERHGLPSFCNFTTWYHKTIHEYFLLKQLKLFPDESVNSDLIKIHEIKSDLDRSCMMDIKKYKVRYRTFIKTINEPVALESNELINENTGGLSPKKLSQRQVDVRHYPYYLWVPCDLVEEHNPLIIRYNQLQRQLEEKSPTKRSKSESPRKRKSVYKQNNTLDGFLSKHASPVKPTQHTIEPPVLLQKDTEVKRRLFVGDDSSNEENQTDPDTEDSLIIVEERDVSPRRTIEYLLSTSPLKRNYTSFSEKD